LHATAPQEAVHLCNEAKKKNWTIISVKNERIFGFEQNA
jgi:hypothetical protein